MWLALVPILLASPAAFDMAGPAPAPASHGDNILWAAGGGAGGAALGGIAAVTTLYVSNIVVGASCRDPGCAASNSLVLEGLQIGAAALPVAGAAAGAALGSAHSDGPVVGPAISAALGTVAGALAGALIGWVVAGSSVGIPGCFYNAGFCGVVAGAPLGALAGSAAGPALFIAIAAEAGE